MSSEIGTCELCSRVEARGLHRQPSVADLIIRAIELQQENERLAAALQLLSDLETKREASDE
jgi:hypothetical protein